MGKKKRSSNRRGTSQSAGQTADSATSNGIGPFAISMGEKPFDQDFHKAYRAFIEYLQILQLPPENKQIELIDKQGKSQKLNAIKTVEKAIAQIEALGRRYKLNAEYYDKPLVRMVLTTYEILFTIHLYRCHVAQKKKKPAELVARVKALLASGKEQAEGLFATLPEDLAWHSQAKIPIEDQTPCLIFGDGETLNQRKWLAILEFYQHSMMPLSELEGIDVGMAVISEVIIPRFLNFSGAAALQGHIREDYHRHMDAAIDWFIRCMSYEHAVFSQPDKAIHFRNDYLDAYRLAFCVTFESNEFHAKVHAHCENLAKLITDLPEDNMSQECLNQRSTYLWKLANQCFYFSNFHAALSLFRQVDATYWQLEKKLITIHILEVLTSHPLFGKLPNRQTIERCVLDYFVEPLVALVVKRNKLQVLMEILACDQDNVYTVAEAEQETLALLLEPHGPQLLQELLGHIEEDLVTLQECARQFHIEPIYLPKTLDEALKGAIQVAIRNVSSHCQLKGYEWKLALCDNERFKGFLKTKVVELQDKMMHLGRMTQPAMNQRQYAARVDSFYRSSREDVFCFYDMLMSLQLSVSSSDALERYYSLVAQLLLAPDEEIQRQTYRTLVVMRDDLDVKSFIQSCIHLANYYFVLAVRGVVESVLYTLWTVKAMGLAVGYWFCAMTAYYIEMRGANTQDMFMVLQSMANSSLQLPESSRSLSPLDRLAAIVTGYTEIVTDCKKMFQIQVDPDYILGLNPAPRAPHIRSQRAIERVCLRQGFFGDLAGQPMLPMPPRIANNLVAQDDMQLPRYHIEPRNHDSEFDSSAILEYPLPGKY